MERPSGGFGLGDAASGGGRFSRAPKSIQDRLTLEAAKKGEGVEINGNLKDPRYRDMVKMEHSVKSKDIVIQSSSMSVIRRLGS